MSRVRKSFERKESFRDSRLILIEVEGNCTEKFYFERIKQEYHNTKINVQVFERDNTNSSPRDVLNNLIKNCDDFSIDHNDLVFMVIDRDCWPIKMLKSAERICTQKKYNFVLSNPNFELWLLLHYRDVSRFKEDKKEKILKNKRISRAKSSPKFIENLLSIENKGYNKNKESSIAKLIPHVQKAIGNAEKLTPRDLNKRGWDEKLSTQVHLIIEEIISQ